MTLGKSLGFPPSQRTYNSSEELPLAKCLTGVEFECENVKIGGKDGLMELPPIPNQMIKGPKYQLPDSLAPFWETHNDDSLRDGGMEFVLREPLFGEDLLTAVYAFCDWATEKKFESNYRTGLHIHIDARNMEIDEFLSMVIYYALFEPIIFKWVGDDREGSIFCMPFYKAEGGVLDIAKAFDSGNKYVMRSILQRVDRYAAFNLNSLAVHGSCEWRHLQTTFDKERIKKWICIAQAFKRYARKFPLKPMELLATMSKGGPYYLLREITGPSLANELWFSGAENDVWSIGLPIAQDIAVHLESNLGVKWDSVRRLLEAGPNPAIEAWKAKLGAKKADYDEVLDTPFTHPGLLTGDVTATQQANLAVREMLRQLLDASVFPS